VEAEDVGAPQGLCEVADQLDAVRWIRREVGVDDADPHTERSSAHRHLAADPPVTDEHQRATTKLDTAQA
jgi:hypothetical protein